MEISVVAVRALALSIFPTIFNAQFFGANVASLMPSGFSLGTFLFTLIFLTVGAWIVGYLWAAFYNFFAKKS